MHAVLQMLQDPFFSLIFAQCVQINWRFLMDLSTLKYLLYCSQGVMFKIRANYSYESNKKICLSITSIDLFLHIKNELKDEI